MKNTKNRITLILLPLVFLLSQGRLVAGDDISFVSAHVPPFSMKDGTGCGFVCEIVAEMANRMDVPWRLTFAPSLPEAMKEANTKENTVIFPLARTKEREPHYTWLQEIIEVGVLFATGPGTPEVRDLKEARALSAIGVRKGFAVSQLTKLGFTNLYIVETPEENARALASGHIDAWYGPEHEILFTWRQSGMEPTLVLGHRTHSIHSYVAASKSSPGIDPGVWRKAFSEMKDQGEVKAIIERYIER